MKPVPGSQSGAVPTWAGIRKSASALGACRVVYLDDDPIYAYLLKVSLERVGHKVSIFSNPVDALAEIGLRNSDVDAFITDFSLPGICGVEVAMEARRSRPKLPRAVITNHFTDAAAVAQEAEILAMPKPSLPHEFVEMLARVLAGD